MMSESFFHFQPSKGNKDVLAYFILTFTFLKRCENKIIRKQNKSKNWFNFTMCVILRVLQNLFCWKFVIPIFFQNYFLLHFYLTICQIFQTFSLMAPYFFTIFLIMTWHWRFYDRPRDLHTFLGMYDDVSNGNNAMTWNVT